MDLPGRRRSQGGAAKTERRLARRGCACSRLGVAEATSGRSRGVHIKCSGFPGRILQGPAYDKRHNLMKSLSYNGAHGQEIEQTRCAMRAFHTLESRAYNACMSFDASSLEEALLTLGELLDTRKQRFEVIVIGGGSLLLMGLIRRPTKDLDVVALMQSSKLSRAEPLPAPLRDAIADVASTLGLADDWLNPGPTSLLDHGLPEGFEERLTPRTFGGLVVHVASR